MKRLLSTLFLFGIGFQIAFSLNVYFEPVFSYNTDVFLTSDFNDEKNTATFGNDLLAAEIVINEILPNGTVELKNIGDEPIDISSYWLCNFPSYSQIGNLNSD